jgi:8-oxo-dGTP diphosphatase
MIAASPAIRPATPGHPATARGLITDTSGRWLIVRPIRDQHWHLPGGRIEQNEPPSAACRRELREELGIDLIPGPLFVLGWNPPRRQAARARFTFVFHMGSHHPRSLAAAIRLDRAELAEWCWSTPHDARAMLHPDMAERLRTTGGIAASAAYVESSVAR